jgi:protein-S-isoprenylcysteine O-methyltransferase Ste14
MWLLIKNLLFTVCVPGVVVGWVPYIYLLRRAAPPPLWSWPHLFALPPLLTGLLVYFACLWQFAKTGRGTPAPIDPPKKLVQRGLYRWVRNPMYLGVLLIVLGEAILFRHLTLLLYFVCLATAFQLFVVLYEEPEMRRRYGAIYSDYCNAVPRWLPRKPRPRLETVPPFSAPR